ncbi:hypothetical protein PPERSA_01597 [Pseudocohnilembus persalinus]|uniref:Uncharacterized protein n=1 Tax=Pseudocohnilembus persalinus TaxID=266149 RepID=A0A0V0QHK4_PSEPJ|nr:hypothetical protein PPERSA_01597 [Pseudocohnilembus persalinus]|eukprot:KRX01727.1 hypothetical protein PPERSA_01597 [Pseudocohnilembus persalinus]
MEIYKEQNQKQSINSIKKEEWQVEILQKKFAENKKQNQDCQWSKETIHYLANQACQEILNDELIQNQQTNINYKKQSQNNNDQFETDTLEQENNSQKIANLQSINISQNNDTNINHNAMVNNSNNNLLEMNRLQSIQQTQIQNQQKQQIIEQNKDQQQREFCQKQLGFINMTQSQRIVKQETSEN